VHVPQTILTLTLFTLAIVFVRIRWDHLSATFKRGLILFASVSVGLMAMSSIGKVSTTVDRLNSAIYWCAVLSYIFFVVLFTRLRPHWLTTLIAIVLILPLLSDSFFLPLAGIFSNLPHDTKPLGNGLVSDLVPIDAITIGARGADMGIYRRLSWLPLLQRRRQAARYFSTQCNASAAYAVLQPDLIHILMVCPALPDHPPDDTRSLVVKLY
jgi:hypothetical protein